MRKLIRTALSPLFWAADVFSYFAHLESFRCGAPYEPYDFGRSSDPRPVDVNDIEPDDDAPPPPPIDIIDKGFGQRRDEQVPSTLAPRCCQRCGFPLPEVPR